MLPIGIYAVDHDGNFLYCNQLCRDILGIRKKDNINNINISEFYVSEDERLKLLDKMEKAGGKLCQQMLEFKKYNSHKTIFVEDNCIRHSSGKNKYYYVGSMLDITQLVRYRQLFDELTAGVFRVNKNHKFNMLNKAVANIFGYDSVDELMGVDERKLWRDSSEFKKFIAELNEKGVVHNYIVQMNRKDKHTIYISKSSKLWKDDDGNVIGREGTFTDVTSEFNYSEAINKLSFGYFEIEFKVNHQKIKHCNQRFAEMLGYSTINGIKGQDIKHFLGNDENEQIIIDAIHKAESEGQSSIQNIEILAVDRRKNEFHALIDIIIRPSPHLRNVIGVIRDISKLKDLEKSLTIKEIELGKTLKDLDKFVHQYISPVMNIDSTAQSMKEILEKRLKLKMDDIQKLEISKKMTDDLIVELDKFLDSVKEDKKDSYKINKLRSIRQRLYIRDSLYSSDPILKELYTREIIIESSDVIHDLIAQFQQRRYSEQYVYLELINEKIEEILDIYILKLQKRILNNTKITYKVIETMRRYLFTGGERKFDFTMINIINIIKSNIELYYDMAKEKGLTINPPKQNYILLNLSETYIDRMISNLILNAVKYSYKRPGGFIRIDIDERRTDIEMKIENFGVPIKKDELEKVFNFGYRGELSYDWNRTGSGIGLADAKNTVTKHGGNITIESKPASSCKTEDIYNVPYLTTVIIILPKRRMES